MTGDTVQMGKNAWKVAKDANVMCVVILLLFRPNAQILLQNNNGMSCYELRRHSLSRFQSEKWDSLTRSWSVLEHGHKMKMLISKQA